MAYPQLLKIPPSRPYSFPTFPDYRPDSSPHPFVNTVQPIRHIGQFVIVRPANHEALQLALPLFIALHVPSAGKLYNGPKNLDQKFGQNKIDRGGRK